MNSLLWPLTISRPQFFIRWLLVWLPSKGIITAYFYLSARNLLKQGIEPPPMSGLITAFLLGFAALLMTFLIFFAVIPRLRDIGAPTWLSLAFYIPLVGHLAWLALLVTPTGFWSRYQHKSGPVLGNPDEY